MTLKNNLWGQMYEEIGEEMDGICEMTVDRESDKDISCYRLPFQLLFPVTKLFKFELEIH